MEQVKFFSDSFIFEFSDQSNISKVIHINQSSLNQNEVSIINEKLDLIFRFNYNLTIAR